MQCEPFRQRISKQTKLSEGVMIYILELIRKWLDFFSGRLLKNTFIEERICRWLFQLEEYIAALPSLHFLFDVTSFLYTVVLVKTMKVEFTSNVLSIFERAAALMHFVLSFPYLSWTCTGKVSLYFSKETTNAVCCAVEAIFLHGLKGSHTNAVIFSQIFLELSNHRFISMFNFLAIKFVNFIYVTLNGKLIRYCFVAKPCLWVYLCLLLVW